MTDCSRMGVATGAACFKCGRNEIPGITDLFTVTLPPCIAAFHGGLEVGSLCYECLEKALRSKAVVHESNLTEDMQYTSRYVGTCKCHPALKES